MKSFYLPVALVCFLAACSTDEEQPVSLFVKPDHFPETTYTFGNNPVTKEGVELGQMLFHDPILSLDNSIACANCHLQAVAFSDPVHRLSVGVQERIGTRNAPPIFNLAFRSNFFWDGGVTHVDFIPINAFDNPNELDEDLENLVKKLSRHSEYPARFKAAFGQEEINSQQLLFALSQFMVTMVSANSRYDQYINGDKSALSAREVKGLQLVETHCAGCHVPPLFTNDGFANNGLDETFSDRGRAIITESDDDAGKFHVPSLRNVELTDPFMHDGRFRTLEQVLTHYQSNVKPSPTLDPFLIKGETLGITITEEEKADIIAFLKALTDKKFTQDKRFANPFLQ